MITWPKFLRSKEQDYDPAQKAQIGAQRAEEIKKLKWDIKKMEERIRYVQKKIRKNPQIQRGPDEDPVKLGRELEKMKLQYRGLLSKPKYTEQISEYKDQIDLDQGGSNY